MHYIYLRVSSDKQADSGAGINAQLDACIKWCDTNNVEYQNDPSYADEGVSGSVHPFDRDGFSNLMKVIQPGDSIVVAKRDRLARNYLMLLVLENELKKEDITIIDAGGLNGDSPEDKLMKGIFDLFAEYERDITKKRTSLSLQAKKKRGEAYCARLYGYRNIDGQFVEDSYEQNVMSHMKRWRKAGKSLRDIANALNEWNVLAPSGKQWYPATVNEILKREEEKNDTL